MENDVRVASVAVEKADRAVDAALHHLPDHAHERGDAASPGDEHRCPVVDQGVEAEAPRGRRCLDPVARLDPVQEMGCDESVFPVPDGDIIVTPLVGGRGDAVGPGCADGADVRNDRYVLSGLEGRQVSLG